jgi:ferredoxin
MVPAFPGETVAGALIAAGRYVLRYTAKAGSPRGVFCGIGYCHDCRMTIDGVPNTRACLAAARPHLRVSTEGVRYPAGPLE